MKKVMALTLALLMILSLVACGGDKPTSTPTSSDKPATSTPATPDKPTEPSKSAEPEKPTEPKILNLYTTSEATNAHYALKGSTQIRDMSAGGLYAFMPDNGKAVLGPQLAASEPADVNGDGKTWNITVSPNAKWENGEAITAETFIWSWKMALDPKLVMNGGSNVGKSNYIEIVNASAYYAQGAEGKTPVAWEDVGIKKIDEMTIQITTVNPVDKTRVMQHFIPGVTTPFYQPLFEKCLSADGTTTTYGSAADKYFSCGPFKLVNWQFGAAYEYERNEHFARADLVKLDGIKYVVVENAGTALQMFEKGEMDKVTLDTAGREKYGDDPRVMYTTAATTYHIEFNTNNPNKPILKNENFRKAFYAAINREELAKMLLRKPAAASIGLLCTPNPADGITFRELASKAGYEPANYGYDPTLAKQLFDQAMKEENLTSLELSVIIRSGNVVDEGCAQYLQENLPKVFGADKFKLTINALPSNNISSVQQASWKSDPAAYELTVSAWSLAAASRDPVGALEIYTVNRHNRKAPYDIYDELNQMYLKGNTDEYSLDIDKRIELAMEMEEFMIEHAVAVPMVYHVGADMFSDRVIQAIDGYDVDLYWGEAYVDLIQ